jgi:hypothetical protein
VRNRRIILEKKWAFFSSLPLFLPFPFFSLLPSFSFLPSFCLLPPSPLFFLFSLSFFIPPYENTYELGMFIDGV